MHQSSIQEEIQKVLDFDKLKKQLEGLYFSVPNLVWVLSIILIVMGMIAGSIRVPLTTSAIAIVVFAVLQFTKLKNSPAYPVINSFLIIVLTVLIMTYAGPVTEKLFLAYLVLSALAFFGSYSIVVVAGIAFVIYPEYEHLLLPDNLYTSIFKSAAYDIVNFGWYFSTLAIHTVLLLVFVSLRKTNIEGIANSILTVSHLQNQYQSNLEYAREIANGNFDYKPNTEMSNDLMTTLSDMSQNIRENAVEERERNWVVQGVADISDTLRRHQDNPQELPYHIIKHLIEYLNANQGGFFVLNDTNPSDKFFELRGAYAYERKKFLEKKVGLREGLVGQAYYEKQLIYLKEIPQNYINISSGLGEATPSELVISPLKVEEEVVGVVEIASFNPFKEFHLEFIRTVSETIGSTLVAAKRNETNNKLLEESQQMAEEMRAQEEEMRQNMEELQATQEDLQRKNKEREQYELQIRKFQAFLQNVIENIGTAVYVIDQNQQYFLINDQFSELLGIEKEALLYSSDKDFFDEKSPLHISHDIEALQKGKPIENTGTIQSTSGAKYKVKITRKLFKDEDQNTYVVGSVLVKS